MSCSSGSSRRCIRVLALPRPQSWPWCVVLCLGVGGRIRETRRSAIFIGWIFYGVGAAAIFPFAGPTRETNSVSRTGLSCDAISVCFGGVGPRWQRHLRCHQRSSRVHLPAGGVGPVASRPAGLFFLEPEASARFGKMIRVRSAGPYPREPPFAESRSRRKTTSLRSEAS